MVSGPNLQNYLLLYVVSLLALRSQHIHSSLTNERLQSEDIPNSWLLELSEPPTTMMSNMLQLAASPSRSST